MTNDEANANQPTGEPGSTEAELIAALEQWRTSDQTLIVCSHRVSFLKLVDRLIVIDGGVVLADGPRDQVLNALQSGSVASPSSNNTGGAHGRA